ncbi:hypothetical protein DT23_10625 [Thioclava indica]|uniref:AB hydrolase-1 domain-containing protein n=2 Tax=Thioclava indica TaxID=1353528 RepID=A0A074JXJ3_9RHOB|nr:hypothetical protein DT23_10625 [Thioclava indica]
MMSNSKRISAIEDLQSSDGRLVYALGGVDLHMRLKKAPLSDALIIGFHGNVDRENRAVPAFISDIPEVHQHAHQLQLADPSLRLSETLTMSWYAGDHLFDAQRLIAEFCKAAAKALGASKVIYFGTSGGGFAALYYSSQHPDSLALVGNPQTDIRKYYQRRVNTYLETCWPDLASIEDLKGQIATNVCDLYAQSISNSVIYLQNSTDAFHLFGHMAPFLSGITRGDLQKRVAVECVFSGRIGHNPVWSVFSPWVRAAIAAPSWSAQDLTETKFKLVASSPAAAPKSGQPSSRFSAADLAMAELLQDHQSRAREKV